MKMKNAKKCKHKIRKIKMPKFLNTESKSKSESNYEKF